MTQSSLDLIKNGLKVALRALLVVTFLWACYHKILMPYDFGLQVATYQILPLGLVNIWAISLPWMEVVCAILLAVGFWTRASAMVTCGMNLVFIIAISMALSADLQLQCGCFASSEAGDQMTAGLIWRDMGLIAAGLFLVLQKPDPLTLDHWLEKRTRRAF